MGFKSFDGGIVDSPELITLIPEDEQEEPPPPAADLGKRLVLQAVMIVCLKVATGMLIRNLAKTIREMDVLYPEGFDGIKWKEQS